MFEDIDNLEIIPLKMGGLDRSDTSKLEKIRSTMALLIELPELFIKLRQWRPSFHIFIPAKMGYLGSSFVS